MLGILRENAGAQSAAGDSASRRADLERQIQQLEKEAAQYDVILQQVSNEKRSLDGEKKALDAEVKRREVEIRRLNLAIRKAGLEIQKKNDDIGVLSKKIDKSHGALSASILLLYAYDRDSALTMLFKNNTISEFLGALHSLGRTQQTIQEALFSFKENRELVEKEKDELEDFEEEQHDLKALQEVERRFLAQKKKEKDELLRLTKGKETIFQQLLQTKKRDIAAFKTQLFYLEKTGIVAEDAVRLAELAAKRTGIRTAFLLALLEVETGKQFEDGVISVGTNIGTGNWERDLYKCYIQLGKRASAEAEKRAFFKITEQLGLDPNKMPVSRKPSYGCGGAMGPAQFLPTTWLRFESRVTELTGHRPPSPWNVEDAFTASAIFLADAGAASQTVTGETQAAKTYLSGNPRCTKYICKSYSSRILSLARDIDRIL